MLLLDDKALSSECEIDLYRASGAGGQKRNKTSSAVRMRHLGSGVIAKASDSRSQADNRRKALGRLREHLALDLREELAADYVPGPELAAVVGRGPLGKNAKTRSQVEYLLQLAAILDVVEARGAALGEAATCLGVTTASLVKLLRGDERLARRVAEMRSQRGLRPLR